jgi:hypothetical protein
MRALANRQCLVGQAGILDAPTGQATVALAANPASGSFQDGTAVLTDVAKLLGQILPRTNCGVGNEGGCETNRGAVSVRQFANVEAGRLRR